MFTIKHAREDLKTHVSACESYDIDKASNNVTLHCAKGETRLLRVRQGETIYVENMHGKTCDVIRYQRGNDHGNQAADKQS